MSCIKTFNSSYCLFDSQKTKKFTHKSKAYAGSAGPKVNANAMLHAAKRDDYERVKILYRCLDGLIIMLAAKFPLYYLPPLQVRVPARADGEDN